MKQIIISVGREFGSGGHIVAQKIAEYYDIPIFNKELLEEMARKEGYSEKALEKYDEKPVNFGFMPLPYAGGNIPIEQEIAMKQFEFIKNKADAGESFVIVGRCADYVLQDLNPFRLFVYADISSKIARCREKGADAAAMTDKELQQKIMSIDKKRARYYQFYTEQDWGNKANYDLCINTTNTEIKKIVAAIEKFIV